MKEKLKITFGLSDEEAETFIEEHLNIMSQMGYYESGKDRRVGKLVFYGSIFSQIKDGGCMITTPEKEIVRGLIIAAEEEITIDCTGCYARMTYLLCPGYGLGQFIAATIGYDTPPKNKLHVLNGFDDIKFLWKLAYR